MNFASVIKKYGYNSQARKVYESMLFQLKHNEIDSFYHEWEVKITKDYRITKIKELIKLWETQTNI